MLRPFAVAVVAAVMLALPRAVAAQTTVEGGARLARMRQAAYCAGCVAGEPRLGLGFVGRALRPIRSAGEYGVELQLGLAGDWQAVGLSGVLGLQHGSTTRLWARASGGVSRVPVQCDITVFSPGVAPASPICGHDVQPAAGVHAGILADGGGVLIGPEVTYLLALPYRGGMRLLTLGIVVRAK